MSKLSENLIRLRAIHNLTQKQIGDHLGVTNTSYLKYEKDQSEPNVERLILLADLYATTLDELVGRESSNISPQLEAMRKEKEVRYQAKILTNEVVNEFLNENQESIIERIIERMKE